MAWQNDAPTAHALELVPAAHTLRTELCSQLEQHVIASGLAADAELALAACDLAPLDAHLATAAEITCRATDRAEAALQAMARAAVARAAMAGAQGKELVLPAEEVVFPPGRGSEVQSATPVSDSSRFSLP